MRSIPSDIGNNMGGRLMELSVTEAFEQIKAWAIAAADAEDPRPLLENIVSACDMKLSW